MKNAFKTGDQKIYKKIVMPEDQAIFQGELLHPVCSTFALARDFEWSSRLFFLEMKEMDEEGVGTFLHHHAETSLPADARPADGDVPTVTPMVAPPAPVRSKYPPRSPRSLKVRRT